MVNKVTLIGRLGQDAEMKRLESGAAVARVSLATSKSYKDNAGEFQEKTEWHNVVAWRFLAEKVEKYKKGTMIYVEGEISSRKYEDKDGNTRTQYDIVASYIRNITGKKSENQNFPTEADAPPKNKTEPRETPITPAATAEGDLPF